MRSHKQIVVVVLVLLWVSFSAHAGTHRISSSDELEELCLTIQPGDTIILAEGTYTDQHFIFKTMGAKDRPVTLRAETPGEVVLNGRSRLSIGGDYLVVDGLLFRGGALKSGSVIDFRGWDMRHARYCVLRNTAIIDYNPPEIDTRYFWVSLYGVGNIVENCYFSGQTHSGVTVCVWLGGDNPASHVIRRNHFANRQPGNGNGFETIRIGTSDNSMKNARCVVTENLFEQCDGEIEIISNKSCENEYTRNTFLRCSGCLTLRHGNRCTVENNVFIGDDAKDVGGVRVIGEGHRVAGNYFSGTKGRAGGAISLQAGIPDSALNGYFQVKDCLIENNTFVDNPGTLFALDEGYGSRGCKLLPQGVTISNNLMVISEGADPMIEAANPPTGIEWDKNVMVGPKADIALPPRIQAAADIPPDWTPRTKPQPLKPADVGPEWMHKAPAKKSAK